ncbi:MAG: TetR/AcrR family transcriptional regulator [Myxococcales bacterium]|nr:TetR/AcrR family transcriptional regulator [Myxococcales bacterium]
MSLRETKKQQVRAQILRVCGRLFRSRGFDATTVNEIVRKAGISRQTFFNYFSGKQAVLTELGLEWLREQGEVPRLGARVARTRQSGVLAGMREATRQQLLAIQGDREFMRLVFTRSGLFFPQGDHVGQPADKRRLDQTRSIFEAVGEVMRAAQATGEIRSDVDPLQAAEIYVSVMVSTTRLWLTNYWGQGEELETRALRAIDIVLGGLKPPDGTPTPAT